MILFIVPLLPGRFTTEGQYLPSPPRPHGGQRPIVYGSTKLTVIILFSIQRGNYHPFQEPNASWGMGREGGGCAKGCFMGQRWFSARGRLPLLQAHPTWLSFSRLQKLLLISFSNDVSDNKMLLSDNF